jgi:hypothetical protein
LSQAADAGVTRVVEAIRNYLSRHADAADSEGGIAAWWMPAMGVQASPSEVAIALERLLHMGLVECQKLPDGRTIYRARGAVRRNGEQTNN